MPMPIKIGPYEIIRKFESLGLSEVYFARDPSDDGQVVIKRLREQDQDNPEVRYRFELEAKIQRRLENTHVVPIYKFDDLSERPYIVMRFMKGGTLKERINGNPLPLDQIIQIMGRVTKALDIAHQNKVVHRDLKPSNILFDENDDAFLSDFGLSKQLDVLETITGTDRRLGTPLYMSPEQIRDPRDVDARSDIFSLAMILYELLTGRHPFAYNLDILTEFSLMDSIINKDVPQLTGDELNKLGLPPECNHIFQKAMAKNRNERYEKASDLAKAVANLLHFANRTTYKNPPPDASITRLITYWLANKLDNQIYKGVANEKQYGRRLLPGSRALIGFISLVVLSIIVQKIITHLIPPTIIPTPSITASNIVLPTNTSFMLPTPTSQAVAKENLSCFLGDNRIYITFPQFQIVTAVGKDGTGNWVLVKTKEFSDCWVELILLDFKGDINSLPISTESSPPELTSTPVPPTLTVSATSEVLLPTITGTVLATPIPTYPPITLRWKIVSYDCNDDGDATNVLIGLDVFGGLSPYRYSPKAPPINAKPGQVLSITVSSATNDSKPSASGNYTVPRATDFKCNKPGSNPVPTPIPSTKTPIPLIPTTITPIPPIPTTITPVPPIPIILTSTNTPDYPGKECNDGEDNDRDGFTDLADPQCNNNGDNDESK